MSTIKLTNWNSYSTHKELLKEADGCNWEVWLQIIVFEYNMKNKRSLLPDDSGSANIFLKICKCELGINNLASKLQ